MIQCRLFLTTSSINTGLPSKQIIKLLLGSPWYVQVLPAPTPSTTTSRDMTHCLGYTLITARTIDLLQQCVYVRLGGL
jgi:hypothetical protein